MSTEIGISAAVHQAFRDAQKPVWAEHAPRLRVTLSQGDLVTATNEAERAGLRAAITQWLTEQPATADYERGDFLAELECYDRPAITLTRHRYVLGKISAKCDYDSAVHAFRLYGGRIDRSTVVAYEAGDEHLGTWEQVWPPAAATPVSAGEPEAPQKTAQDPGTEEEHRG